MSTPAAALLLASLALAGQAGCSSAGSSGDRMLQLTPDLATVLLAPSQQGSVGFLLQDSRRRPAAGRTVSFAIIPTDPTGAQGATLAASTGTTDASGHVTVEVHAGLSADFQVQAQSGDAIGQVTVVVHAGSVGNLLIAPFFATPMSQAAQRATQIRVFLYQGGSCAGIPPDDPDPPPASRSYPAVPIGQSGVPIPYVSVDSPSAVFAQALGPGTAVLASGCVDVPGSSLQPGLTVQVLLPLLDTVLDPVGTFTVTSTLTFAPPLAASATLAVPWANLSDCPLDPAQLWLDCTVDALSPTGDPLDCVPAPGAGAEGPVGDAIAARRGAFLVDGTGAATACRGATASGGAEALDALVLGLFGTPAPAALTDLPGVASDAASILQSIRLISSLEVEPGSQAGSYVVTHTLQTAQFGSPGWPVSIGLATLGLPVLQAVTSATIERESLVIGQHGFTLRLGTTARAAFGPLALVPRGFPADVPGFVQALFMQARSAGGPAKGCAALDATVCPAIGQPAGCVSAACASGLTALASILDRSFLAADGPDLDLQLDGTAPMVPVPGGLRAQRLGLGEASSPSAARWNAQVLTSEGSAMLSAPFEGVRD